MSRRIDKPVTDFICPIYKAALIIREGPDADFESEEAIACDGEECQMYDPGTKKCGLCLR